MTRVGEILKKRRELESKSLDDIITQTMIAKKYIVAFEEGNYEPFPGKIYAKGFLRNYANFLGFDENETNNLLAQYELEWQETHLELPVSISKKIPTVSKTNRLLYIIIFILVTSLSFLLIFYLTKQKLFHQDSSINYLDSTKILQDKDISEVENIIIEGEKIREEKVEQPGMNKLEKVIVEAFAIEDVWLQAIIDGKVRKEVLLAAGRKIKWQANKSISLIIGNAGGVVFKLNEQYIGALGGKGEVKKILVTSKGLSFIKTQEILRKEEVGSSSFTFSNIPSPLTSTSTTEKLSIPTTTE